MTDTLKLRNSKIYREAKNLVFATNRVLGKYQHVIWLIADGRSGSTWISNLINYNKKYRELFEPIHPTLVDRASFLTMHEYVRTGDKREELQHLFADIFSGRLTDARVDFGNPVKLYQGLLIKDVFANLMAHWAATQWPAVHTVLLMRNPFMVALSKNIKRDWDWFIDPLAFLQQPDLKQDYLNEFENYIHYIVAKNDFMLNCILTWAIINYVPLKQFNQEQLSVIFYENVKLNPQQELGNIVNDIRDNAARFNQVFVKPSRVVIDQQQPSVAADDLLNWQNQLTRQQIDTGYDILERFGLHAIYDAQGMPDKNALHNFLDGGSDGP